MIKKILITGLALFSLTLSNAQNTQVFNRTCGTEVPSQQWDEWFNKKVAEYKEHLVKNKLQMPNYTIPVVVHIIHAGGAVGVGDNISQAQVIDQINILQATYQAMHQCVDNLKINPELLLIDGNRFLKYKTPSARPDDQKQYCAVRASRKSKDNLDNHYKKVCLDKVWERKHQRQHS
jgi:hypothetical protein